MYVEVRQGSEDSKKSNKEYLEDAIKEFKRRVKKEGIMHELKLRESYMAPSLKKRYRRNEAMKRRKREERKQMWHKKNENSQSDEN